MEHVSVIPPRHCNWLNHLHRNQAEVISAGALVTQASAVIQAILLSFRNAKIVFMPHIPDFSDNPLDLAMGLRPPYPNKSHWLCKNKQVHAEACFCICIPYPCQNKYDAVA